MKLSTNFTLDELTKSQEAIRKGLDNTPNQKEIDNLTILVNKVLQPIRDNVGAVKVNSGYRSPLVNSSVGGSTTSDHCKGMAADIECSTLSNYELAVWIKHNLEFTQLILEAYKKGQPNSGWVHVSYNPSDLKCQVLTATFTNGKATYKNGLEP